MKTDLTQELKDISDAYRDGFAIPLEGRSRPVAKYAFIDGALNGPLLRDAEIALEECSRAVSLHPAAKQKVLDTLAAIKRTRWEMFP